MRSNRFRVRVSLVFLLVSVAAGVLTIRLAGQQPPVGKVVPIHVFTAADGANPATGLIQMPNGTFVGMTKGIGNQVAQPPTVYTMTPDGTVTSLYTFAKDTSQGWQPLGITQASDGNLYAALNYGAEGAVSTIIRLTPQGVFTLVHTFSLSDQIVVPLSGLVEASDGNLYGVATGASGAGTIYRVNVRSQKTSPFFSFTAGAGPWQTSGGLALGPDGRLYGVTSAYTAPDGSRYPGCIYAIDTSGNLTVLSVNKDPLVGFANDKPAIGSDGYLYFAGSGGSGTACPGGCGTIFRVAMTGSDPELLYSFTGGADHSGPAYLVAGSDGRYYGSYPPTLLGGFPSIFQFDPVTQSVSAFDLPPGAGTLLQLYLLQAAGGVIRGTTQRGAAPNMGTSIVLNLTLPAPPPVITGFAPTSGPPGTVVTVWGANFVGLKSVAVNGVAAQGQAKSSAFIRFSVPASATTGPITVTTVAGGSVASSSNFTVQ